jgi:hypothetical protein
MLIANNRIPTEGREIRAHIMGTSMRNYEKITTGTATKI